jgi:hypothetical protein
MATPTIGNGEWLLTMRKQKKVPGGLVLISFVGKLVPGNFTLYASPGRRYDWRLIKNLRVCAVIDDGIGTARDLRPIAEQARTGEAHVWHLGKSAGAWIYPDDVVDDSGRIVRHQRVRSITWTNWQNDCFAAAFRDNEDQTMGEPAWSMCGTRST